MVFKKKKSSYCLSFQVKKKTKTCILQQQRKTTARSRPIVLYDVEGKDVQPEILGNHILGQEEKLINEKKK